MDCKKTTNEGKRMKVTIDKQEEKKEIKYPCLMVGRKPWHIYIITSDRKGLALVTSNNTPTGNYCEYLDMSILKPFTGTITLEND